jgi:hypothetical protein
MKSRNREVSIFNMSVLDLLTGALGAFCFLTLALFPYYFKAQTISAQAAEVDRTASALKQDNESLKDQIAQQKASGNQMPPFALLQVSTSDKVNNDCAKLTLISAGVPPGSPPMGYRSASFGYYLFAIRPGIYHIAIQATLTEQGLCSISVVTLKNTAKEAHRQITRSQQLEFDYPVMNDDFAGSLFD